MPVARSGGIRTGLRITHHGLNGRQLNVTEVRDVGAI
jgi:hypothetical protein